MHTHVYVGIHFILISPKYEASSRKRVRTAHSAGRWRLYKNVYVRCACFCVPIHKVLVYDDDEKPSTKTECAQYIVNMSNKTRCAYI